VKNRFQSLPFLQIFNLYRYTKEMSAAAGMNMSDEQAAQTAKMMQDISPETMQRWGCASWICMPDLSGLYLG
jgi:hypothetical protein